jgi:hypothetical protein
MAKRKRSTYKTIQRKSKIEQHEPHYKSVWTHVIRGCKQLRYKLMTTIQYVLHDKYNMNYLSSLVVWLFPRVQTFVLYFNDLLYNKSFHKIFLFFVNVWKIYYHLNDWLHPVLLTYIHLNWHISIMPMWMVIMS